MKIKLDELSQARRYYLLISCIVPRPIAWVGTSNEDGSANLAPFSFFNGMSSSPPVVAIGFSPHEDKAQKDTLRNVLATRELSISIPTVDQAEAVFASADDLPYGASEFGHCGLVAAGCEAISAPRVSSAKVCLECTLREHIALGGLGSTMILADVVLVHLDDTLLDNHGTVNPHALKPLGRLGGGMFCGLGEVFKLPRE